MASDNRALVSFNCLAFLLQRGIPQVRVTADIDANGILKVTAKRPKATDKSQEITISGSTALSTTRKLTAWSRTRESHATRRQERRTEIEVRNQVGSLAYSTEQAVKTLAIKVPEDQKKAVDCCWGEGRA